MHLSAQLDIDLVALESQDEVAVLLDLQAPEAPATGEPRQQHTAVVVLDRSGSMGGGRLEAAKRALLLLVSRLDDRDRFGLVTFASQARVMIPAGVVGDLGRERLRQQISGIRAGGTTDLSSGYLRGLQEARRVCGDTGATIVLLSDGRANSGVTDPEQLRQVAAGAAKQSITTSTIGIGTGYDETILAAVAAGGLGNHAFAEHADGAAAAVAAELDGLLAKTVQAASLLIAPSPAVQSVRLLNDGIVAQPVEGGVMVELGDFYAGEQRKVVVSLGVPAMDALGLAQVATLSLNYVELPKLEQHTVTVPISVNVVPGDEAAGRIPNPIVVRERLLLRTQAAKLQAAKALLDGDAQSARTTLTAAQADLNSAAELMDEELAAEGQWLKDTQRLLDERGEAYNAKRLWSDHSRKSRGYKSRTQGGEVDLQPPPSGT